VSGTLIRFILGGGTTVGFEYLTFYLLYVNVGLNLLVANSLSFVVGLGISFLFNRLWAFKQETYKRRAHHQIALYIILATTNLVLNNAIVDGLQYVGIDPRIGKIIAILLIAVWNFVIYRKIIFAANKNSETAV
jgi:putative flippase GtrA